ncbi:MAG: retroviral-like aspartic protease family protein [Limnochordaceae bacterium]|nr:retroviral-like aspartic protease family protein [Limnochordaceae bacterium]
MRSRYPYDTSCEPPAPVVPVRISVPGSRDRGVALAALIDSGADVTVIPTAVAGAMGLPPIGALKVSGVAGIVRRAIVYAAEVEINGLRRTVEVVGLGQEALLGRNFINQCVLTLDGPELQAEVTA